jgi:hypothetical protein
VDRLGGACRGDDLGKFSVSMGEEGPASLYRMEGLAGTNGSGSVDWLRVACGGGVGMLPSRAFPGTIEGVEKLYGHEDLSVAVGEGPTSLYCMEGLAGTNGSGGVDPLYVACGGGEGSLSSLVLSGVIGGVERSYGLEGLSVAVGSEARGIGGGTLAMR